MRREEAATNKRETPGEGLPRLVKGGALALGLVGLLVVVALAARGGHPSGTGRVSQREVPQTVQDSLVTLLTIVYVVVIVAVVILFAHRRPWRDPDSHWLRNFVTVMGLMAIVTVIGYWVLTHGHLRQKAEKAQGRQEQQQRPEGRGRVQPMPARPAHFQWPLALAVVGLIVVGGVLVFIRERRPLPTTGFAGVEEEVAQVLETTIDDLQSERDARRAVIAAYAQMERVLASHGLPRHRAETPFEYLARLLRQLHVRESAVRSLTQLFEYAKFSPHEIDDRMKEEAIAALTAVRDDLRRDEAVAA